MKVYTNLKNGKKSKTETYIVENFHCVIIDINKILKTEMTSYSIRHSTLQSRKMSDKVTLGIIIIWMINLCFCSSRGLGMCSN